MQWYEIWSKAGATPNYRVDNFDEYLRNFNWVSNWIDKYFFNKFFDFFLGVIFSIFILCLFFFPKNINLKNFKKYFIIIFHINIIINRMVLESPSIKIWWICFSLFNYDFSICNLFIKSKIYF